jgi:tetratricopeptide (TPR) repeat protein
MFGVYGDDVKYNIILSLIMSFEIPLVAGETNNLSHYNAGVAYVEQKEWTKAIHEFSEALRSSPTNVLAYEYRGAAYCVEGNIDEAIRDFSRGLQFDPANARLLFNRGSAYRSKCEFEKAIGDLTESLRLNSTNDLTYKTRAACYSATHQFDKAEPDWCEGLRLNPRDAIALYERGMIYSKLGRFDREVADYKAAVRIDPEYGKAYNALAWVQATCSVASIRNGKEAVEAATKACNLSKWANGEWIDTLAAASAEAGDFTSAVKYEQQAMEMSDITEQSRADMQRRLRLYQNKQPSYEQ